RRPRRTANRRRRTGNRSRDAGASPRHDEGERRIALLPQPPVWLVLIAFLCARGPLVFFHELGHYLIARLFGIPAETFSIGFGREVVGWSDRQGTAGEGCGAA